MYCTNCGNMLGVTHKFCERCGTPALKTPLPSKGVVSGQMMNNMFLGYMMFHHLGYGPFNMVGPFIHNPRHK